MSLPIGRVGRAAGRRAVPRRALRRGDACSPPRTRSSARSARRRTHDAPPPIAPLLERWEMVVGLEVHVQLKTRTKAFCGCSTDFGAAPNANTCPVCLALPGALPVLNARAVELATRAALALELHGAAASRSSRARTTSIPTCRRATRSRSSTSRSRSAGCDRDRRARRRRADPHRHHARAHGGGRGQVGARSLRRRRRRSTSIAPACRSSRS